MPNQTHSTITDPDIHETKGMQTAAAGTVKMATGSGASTFNKPLELISTFDVTHATQAEKTFTNLEDYRTLHLVLEHYVGSTTQSLILQFSTNNGSSYITSGYKSSWIDTDNDELNTQTSGCFLLVASSTNKFGFGISTISNFNDSSNYTSVMSKYSVRNVNQINSASSPGQQEPGSAYCYYPTNQAHNAMKITGTFSQTNPRLVGSLWGIRG